MEEEERREPEPAAAAAGERGSGSVQQASVEIVAQKASPFAGREPRAFSQWERELKVQRALEEQQDAQAKEHGLAIVNVSNKAQLKQQIIRAQAKKDLDVYLEQQERIKARQAAEAFQNDLIKNREALAAKAAIEAQEMAERSQMFMSEPHQKLITAPPLRARTYVADDEDEKTSSSRFCAGRTRWIIAAGVTLLVVVAVVVVVLLVAGVGGAFPVLEEVYDSLQAEDPSRPFVQVLVRFKGIADETFFTCTEPVERKKQCKQHKSDVRRAVARAFLSGIVEPGDVMVREVVKYGQALTTQDQPSMRTLHTYEPDAGASTLSARALHTEAEGAGGDVSSITMRRLDAREGDASATRTVHTVGRDVLFAKAADVKGEDAGGEASSTRAMHPIGEHTLYTRTVDSEEGGLQGRDVARGEGGGRGRSLLQAPLEPSISAVFRIVCKNISVAMAVQNEAMQAIGDGNLDKSMAELGYKDIETSVLGPALVTIPPVCGDGSRHEQEACDDGNLENDDGCSSSCAVEMGWECNGGENLKADVCETLCGNAVPTFGEECDDGNVVEGDGCDSKCQVQMGWLCTQVQSVGPSVCQKFVDTPAFDPPAGSISVTGPFYDVGAVVSIQDYYLIRELFLNVTMSSMPASAAIFFSIDGSDPLDGSLVFGGTPLKLKGGSTRVRAVAVSEVAWPFWMDAADQALTPVVSMEALGDFTVSICQDGIRTSEEECDDGVGGGEGCSMECTVENGWVCDDEVAPLVAQHAQAEVKSKCSDCNAAAIAAALEAEAQGLPPPPLSTLNCPSGFFMGEICDTCVPCPQGFFCKGGPENERYPCDVGTYADQSNAFTCSLCPDNSASNRAAKSISECECSAGLTGIPTSESGCVFCVDSYKPLSGPEACIPCPPHSITPVSGSTAVLQCQCLPGYHNRFVTEWWASVPSLDENGNPYVVLFVPAPTAIQCFECEGGYYCEGGNAPQKQCALDSWSPPGSASCNVCPTNTGQPVATPITTIEECACAPGFYSQYADKSPPCAPCPAGLYKENVGSDTRTSCLTCPPGSFSSSPNATQASICTPCSTLGGARDLTSPRGGASAEDCSSGAWLAVANMVAAKGRPTRVYAWNFDGNGGLDTSFRAHPRLPEVFDSDELGRLPDVTGVRWIQERDWNVGLQQKPPPRNPEALLLASTYGSLYLLQMQWPAPGEPMHLTQAQKLSKPQIGQTLEVVVYHLNNPVLIIATQVDSSTTPGGVIYTLEPPDGGAPPVLKPLKGSGAVFLGPTKHTSDMHAFQPVVPSGSQRTWYLALANQRFQLGPNVQFDAESIIYKWVPGAPNPGCVSPDWDCGRLQEVQRLATHGASDFESFQIGDTHFLVLSSGVDALNSHEPLRVYKVDVASGGDLLTLHQTIQSPEARWITPFSIENHIYLAVAQWRGQGALSNEALSPIFRWDETAQEGLGGFVLFQTLPTLGARRWRHLAVKHASHGQAVHTRHLLAVANHYSNSVNIDSALYMWDPDTGVFNFFQTFATSAAADLAWLTLEA